MKTDYLKNISNGVHFFDKAVGWVSATLPKMYSLASTFQAFRSDLLLSIRILRYFRKVYFPQKNWLWLLTVVRFSKYSFPQKLYIRGFGVLPPLLISVEWFFAVGQVGPWTLVILLCFPSGRGGKWRIYLLIYSSF